MLYLELTTSILLGASVLSLGKENGNGTGVTSNTLDASIDLCGNII